jgi:2',3'-cyclic-nucleotide 2'-phosphodiesterase (5'-nucleotidase family)
MLSLRALRLGAPLCAALYLLGCDVGKPAPTDAAKPVVPVAEVASPALEAAHAQAQSHFAGALRLGMRDALPLIARAAHDQLLKVSGERPANAPVFTLIVTSNIHGEREDCGCKMNPLGGLARHATLTLLAKTPADAQAVKYWGKDLPQPQVVLRADAGDLLFRSASVSEWGEDQKKLHMRAAQAVIAGLNAAPPDVINVGELDLALGWEGFRRLREGAKAPFISANLRLPDGSAPLPASVIVERGGAKIAFIGLLKEQSLIPDYWKTKGVKVEPAAPAYLEAARALPTDVKLVVLLSNLGLSDTERLVKAIRAEGGRVDAALVSNTNSLSPRPLWPAGVPMVEAMSRGKHIGRLDLWLPGEAGQVVYRNGREDMSALVQAYGRRYATYQETRAALRELERQRAELLLKQPAGADTLSADVRRTNEERLNTLAFTIQETTKRLVLVAGDLAEAGAALEQAWGAGTSVQGSAWAEWRHAEVKLDIAQHPAVRKALDAHRVPEL